MTDAEMSLIDRRTGSLQVLLELFIDGPLRRTKLYRRIQLDRGTVARSVGALAGIGLVSVQTERVFPFTATLALTALGRSIVTQPLSQWPSILFVARCSKLHEPDPGRVARFAVIRSAQLDTKVERFGAAGPAPLDTGPCALSSGPRSNLGAS